MLSLLAAPVVLCLVSFASAAGPPSLIPPSTFDSASSSASGSTTTGSASGSSSMPATPTSSALFPSLSGFSTCVTNCLQLAVSVNCSSVAEVNCYCKSSRFTQDIVNCAATNCPGDLTTVETLAQRFCNLASQPASLSFPSTTSKPSSTLTSSSAPTNTAPSATSDSTSTSPSPTASNAASSGAFAGSGNFGSSTFLGMGVASLGVILGAFLVD
ncbi:putative CFEM domain containing protein [Lyophyllum shimeji]|uniref:CFEM domain containing protein n=1 Tax=Lyophyllum shimeji TaxID=47721 RepID=A0A9P3PRG5_LYOSH|nr:putative CFEM domain containing protein [Lyophyllum shimeji]